MKLGLVFLSVVFLIGCGDPKHTSPVDVSPEIEPTEPIEVVNNCESLSDDIEELKITNEMLLEQVINLIEQLEKKKKKRKKK